MSTSPIPRRRVLATAAIVFLAAFSPTVLSAGRAEATTAKAGRACVLRETGLINRASTLMCVQIRNCAGALKMLWVPLGRGEAFPGEATMRRYGQCATATTTTAVARTTTTAPRTAAAAGAGCLIGTWTYGSADMNAYLVQATGGAVSTELSGLVTYRIEGAPSGDALTGATVSGTGTITGRSADGLVVVNVRPTVGAVFDATATTMTWRNNVALFAIEVSVGGSPMPLGQADLSGGGATGPYECSATTLKLTSTIPAAAGSPARTATATMHRA